MLRFKKIKNAILKLINKSDRKITLEEKKDTYNFKKVFKIIPRKLGIVFLIVAVFLAVYLYGISVVRQAETTLKVGFVTDWEYGYKNKIGNKLTNKAPEELEKVVSYFNNEFRPDIVVEGGDMVESSLAKRNTTIKQFGEINEIFSKINAQKEYALGNHDLRNLSKEELKMILGIDYTHKYFDIGDWRLVIMDTNFDKKGDDRGPNFYVSGYVSDSEFEWLEEALSTERPTIVFSHHPVVPHKEKNIGNGDKVSAFFEKFDNIVLAVAGHEPNFIFNKKNNINYLVVDNLANADSIGSFATLEMKYNKYTYKSKINIEHYGPSRKSIVIDKALGQFNLKEFIIKKFQSLSSQIFHS